MEDKRIFSEKTYDVFRDEPYLRKPSLSMTQQIRRDGCVFEFSLQLLEMRATLFPKDTMVYHIMPTYSRLIAVRHDSVKLEWENGTTLPIREKTIYFLPSGHPFYTTYPFQARTAGFHFYLRDPQGLVIGSDLPDVITDDTPEHFRIFEYLMSTSAEEQLPGLMMLLIPILGDHLLKHCRKKILSPVCQSVIDTLKEHPAVSPPFAAFARDFHISPSALSSLFRRETGLSPHEYRAELMLEKAQHLLVETSLSVKEIAAELGYADVNRFFLFFRSKMNMTPLEFRKSYLPNRTSL